MKALQKSYSLKSYDVRGKTLAEIHIAIMKKGPVDSGVNKRCAGGCEPDINISPGKLDFKTTPGNPVKVTASFKDGTVTSHSTITIPKLASERELSPKAQQEWKRFLAKVLLHERGHDAANFLLAKTICDELNDSSAEGIGTTEQQATDDAIDRLDADFKANYSADKLRARIDTNTTEYDNQTRHGVSQGALLNTDIQ